MTLTIEKGLKQYGILIVAFFAWFIFKGRFGVYTVDKTSMWFSIAIAGFYLVKDFMAKEQLETPHLVGQDIWGSCFYPPFDAGMWYIFTIGDIKFFGIRGRRAVVVPKVLAEKFGQCWCLRATPFFQVPSNQLPAEARRIIETHNLKSDYVHFAMIPKEWHDFDKDIIIDELKYLGKNTWSNSQEDIIQGKGRTLRNVFKDLRIMNESAQTGALKKIERVFKKNKKGDDEDD